MKWPWQKPDLNSPWHVCDHELRGVTTTNYGSTEVLYVCACGDTRTRYLSGVWTPEQLAGSKP